VDLFGWLGGDQEQRRRFPLLDEVVWWQVNVNELIE
jgi:hypothetical protein